MRWYRQLATSVHSLRYAAIRAEQAYQAAQAATAALTDESVRCNDTGTVSRRHDTNLTFAPLANTTAEITNVHTGMTRALSRVWYRAAHAYAYGTATTLHAVLSGERPSTAVAPSAPLAAARMPFPEPAGMGLVRQLVEDAEEEFNSDFMSLTNPASWEGPAQAWQAYGSVAYSRLTLELCAAAHPSAQRI